MMKVHVVKNEHGKVLATFEKAPAGKPSLMPVLKPGYKIHEVEAAENYRSDIRAFYDHHSR